jgi:hypothetical protein
MRRDISAALVALLLGACGAEPCRDNTLYLTLAYSGSAQSADSVALDVTVGGAHKHYERPRVPGQTRDALEIVFATYPAQQTFNVVASANDGGAVVGVGEVSGTLAADCTAMSVTLSAQGSANDGGSSAPDLSDNATVHDLAAADLAGVVPVIAFNGETDTELHPNGNGGTLPFDTHCTAGYAIAGFAFALAKDGNGNVIGINRADALCVKPLVTPTSNGGFAVTWDPNHASQIPGVGTSDPTTVQYTCPMPDFLVGFSGRADASSLFELLISCAPIQLAANHQVSLGATVDTTDGVGSKTNGSPFGPAYCPAGQVATSVISRGTPGSPPVAFGFGCSSLSAQP